MGDRGNMREVGRYVELGLACLAALDEVREIQKCQGSYPSRTDILEYIRDSLVAYCEGLSNSIVGVYKIEIPSRTTKRGLKPLFQSYKQATILSGEVGDASKASSRSLNKLAYARKLKGDFDSVLEKSTLPKQRLRDCRKIYDFLNRLGERSVSCNFEFFRLFLGIA